MVGSLKSQVMTQPKRFEALEVSGGAKEIEPLPMLYIGAARADEARYKRAGGSGGIAPTVRFDQRSSEVETDVENALRASRQPHLDFARCRSERTEGARRPFQNRKLAVTLVPNRSLTGACPRR